MLTQDLIQTSGHEGEEELETEDNDNLPKDNEPLREQVSGLMNSVNSVFLMCL